jgi:uncharacterized protein YceK
MKKTSMLAIVFVVGLVLSGCSQSVGYVDNPDLGKNMDEEATLEKSSSNEGVDAAEEEDEMKDEEQPAAMSEIPEEVDEETAADLEAIDEIFNSVDVDDFSSDNLDEIEAE